MMNKLKSKVIADSYNSWLIIENTKEVCQHSLAMMEGVEAFCSLSYKEDEESFYINISKFLNLRELLNHPVSEKTLFKLALQAIDARIDAIKFLLPTEGIVYDLDLSYFEPESKTLHMIFLPNRETSSERDFTDWLKELIELSSIKENREEAKSILRYLDSKEYSLINLKQRIILALGKQHTEEQDRIINHHSELQRKELERIAEHNNYRAIYQPKKPAVREYNTVKQKHTGFEQRKTVFRELKNSGNTKNSYEDEKRKNKENEKTENKSAKMKRLAFILSQIAIILLYLASCLFFKNKVEPFYKLALGLFIFFTLIDYVLLKNLYLNEFFMKKEKKKNEPDGANHKPKTKPEKKIISKKSTSPGICENIEDFNRTLCLDNPLERQMALINKQNGEISTINKPEYIIGRQGYEADLALNDKSVGRLHAFIREESEHYYLIDNASVNGTFINGIRIHPGEYNEISVGDELIFSRVLFQFSRLDY